MSPLYGEPPDGNSGRPPDFVAQLSAFPVLERLASPLEDARNPKKQCNKALSDGMFHAGETVVMEVDVGLSNRGLRVQKQAVPRSSHISYVNADTGFSRSTLSLNDNSIFLDEEVEPLGDIQLIDLENNYFLVKFANGEDYVKAFTEGPWTIYRSYLIVQPWSRTVLTS
ncbi:hypothetical protein GQ457_16G015770 [Hibiscus cannabinus]